MSGGRQPPAWGRRARNRGSLEDDIGDESPTVAQHRLVGRTPDVAPPFQRQTSDGDTAPNTPGGSGGGGRPMTRPGGVSVSTPYQPQIPRRRTGSQERNHSSSSSNSTSRQAAPPHRRPTNNGSPRSPSGAHHNLHHRSPTRPWPNVESLPVARPVLDGPPQQPHLSHPASLGSRGTSEHSRVGRTSLLGTHLPDGWSCPENNDARIILQRQVQLSKVENKSCMVMANKPIPVQYLQQVGAASNSMSRASTEYVQQEASRRTFSQADTPNFRRSESASSGSSMVYYFEATLLSGGVMWIGLVHENDTLEKNVSSKCPYHVAMDRYPGDIPDSIGISSDGRLLVGGMFEDLRGFGSTFVEGDTLGCGFEILGLRRVFFTKNGRLLESPRKFDKFDMKDNAALLPVVALTDGNISVVGNFGLGREPLKWKGEDRLCIVSPTDLVDQTTRPSTIPEFDLQSEGTSTSRARMPERTSSLDSGRNLQNSTDPESSARPGAYQEAGPPPRSKTSTMQFEYISPEDIDHDKTQASALMQLCIQHDKETQVSVLLQDCKMRMKEIDKTVNMLLSRAANEEEVNAALDLASVISNAITVGDNYLKTRIARKPSFPSSGGESSSDTSSIVTPPKLPSKPSQSVVILDQKKDVFSLICMLRAHDMGKRLDAALALMRFAGGPDDTETRRLKDEIRSTGGIPSLLTLFRAENTPRDLKVVAAMAVAHLTPTFISSNGFSSLSEGGMGLKIIECLRFLSTSAEVSPRGERITVEAMCNAATLAAAEFWMNSVIPALSRPDTVSRGDGSTDTPFDALSYRARGRHLQMGSDVDRQDTLEVQELVETTVSLVVHLSKLECRTDGGGISRGEPVPPYALVDAVCGLEAARPIAVREGLLKVLVTWLESNDRDKVAPAASALRFLTSTKDKYMAGWIHSQLVNEKALAKIVQLLGDGSVGHRVRLAVAEILCSLCVAPHTRAALINAKCTIYLIQVLHDHNEQNSKDIVLAAARSLVQLASGAIARAGVYRRGDTIESSEALSSHTKDDVISNIINLSAIPSFVSMAESKDSGPLRLTSVEALRVISEDVTPSRNTRIQLCTDSAAKALGHVLWEDVRIFCKSLNASSPGDSATAPEDVTMELYHALCALANILEPAHNDMMVAPALEFGTPEADALVEGCIQTAEHHGLDSLLQITSLPYDTISFNRTDAIGKIDLLIESVRSLASLSPLLLSERLAQKGFAGRTCHVLGALIRVLKCTAAIDDNNSNVGLARELQYDAWRGIGSLADFEPLKLIIVDESLQFLMQAKDSRGDKAGVSNVANVAKQVCHVLGFTENEIAVQVAGNDPKLLGDWFCLQRSLVIQAMAREEIRRTLTEIWREPVRKLKNSGETHGYPGNNQNLFGQNAGDEWLQNLFEGLEDDDGSAELRKKILEDYGSIFEGGASRSCEVPGTPSVDGDLGTEHSGLLSRHAYPLNKVETEKEWILGHKSIIDKRSGDRYSLQASSNLPGARVQKLLDCCFPSRLLQKEILPIFDLRLDSSFNFCSLLMPERKYFSFRREGQIVSRLCDKHAAATNTEDVHWTLVFTNSSFAGEFTETLVQALYRSPVIQSLSFARNSASSVGDEGKAGEDGSASLANLFGSLPPWISSLTFDNIVSEKFLRALVGIIDMMGKLSAGEQDHPNPNSPNLGQGGPEGTDVGQKQGAFRCLSLRNSPQLGPRAFRPFLDLLGSFQFKPALNQLRLLDISGNNLGDEACASVLDSAHSEISGCSIEQLDMSRNNIREGLHVGKVLWMYVSEYRNNQTRGMELEKRRWCSRLHTLNVSSNHLCEGDLASTLILMLKNNTLKLRSLDLSDNDLRDDMKNGSSDGFYDVFCDSLTKNSALMELDMSGNRFSSTFLDETLGRLSQSESHAGVSFLRFDNNTPSLSVLQRGKLNDYVVLSRQATLERFLRDKAENRNVGEDLESLGSAVSPLVQLPSIDERDNRSREPGRWNDVESTDSSIAKGRSLLRQQLETPNENLITVLFSAPLVYKDKQRRFQPFAKLDFVMERELMWQCLKEACRDIELAFDNATSDRLVATMTKAKRCGCLHYSGHGHEAYLPLENGKGGTHWLQVDELQNLLASGVSDGDPPFKLVFVSACHSYRAGETFANAGVPHVVCCQQDSELKDASALAFTRQFYLALAVGRTVQESFEMGCKAVRLSPHVKNAAAEMRKFVLLPSDGKHNVPVFDAKRLFEWPKSNSLLSSRSKRRNLTRSRSAYFGGIKNSELSVRNMMQEDPSPTPPQFFLGREVDMHKVLNLILEKRLVSVTADSGYGSSSLACAICHYINERRNTLNGIEKIYFVNAKRSRSDRIHSLITPFLKKLEESRNLKPLDPGADEDAVFGRIFKTLRSSKALIVFDKTELLEGSEEAQDFPRFLSELFQRTTNVKVLLTGSKQLQIRTLGGVGVHPYKLGPLNFHNTVKLFTQLCPQLHTLQEREAIFRALVTDGRQALLSPGAEGIDDKTQRFFEILGNGVPLEIEKAAYENFDSLQGELDQVRDG